MFSFCLNYSKYEKKHKNISLFRKIQPSLQFFILFLKKVLHFTKKADIINERQK